MKIRSRLPLACLASIMFCSVDANAYFDPHVGRFLARDPIGELTVFSRQVRRQPSKYVELFSESLKPSYVFVSNDSLNHFDPLGLNVYKIKLPSGVSGSIVDHRQIVGDDGNGGCYILEFYPAKKCYICVFGAHLIAPGEVHYSSIRSQSASEYISDNGLNVVATVETDNVFFYPSFNGSVDSHLARDAKNYEQTGSGNYILLWNDCGTIANIWLRHAREVLKQAENSIPDGGF